MQKKKNSYLIQFYEINICQLMTFGFVLFVRSMKHSKLAIKPEKNRKHYRKCSNNFAADCKRFRVHSDDSKIYNNEGSEMFFRSGRWRCAKVPSFLARNRHFTQGCQVNRMTDYANVELANKHSAYKTADCSGQQRNTCMRNDIPRDVIPVIISLEAFTRC